MSPSASKCDILWLLSVLRAPFARIQVRVVATRRRLGQLKATFSVTDPGPEARRDTTRRYASAGAPPNRSALPKGAHRCSGPVPGSCRAVLRECPSDLLGRSSATALLNSSSATARAQPWAHVPSVPRSLY